MIYEADYYTNAWLVFTGKKFDKPISDEEYFEGAQAEDDNEIVVGEEESSKSGEVSSDDYFEDTGDDTEIT